MNWKDDLIKRAKEINPKLLEGGESKDESVSVRGSGRVSDSSSRNARNKAFKSKRKNINPIKGGEIMITRDGALSDLQKLKEEVKDSAVGKAIIGSFEVVIKFLSTMRTNQLYTDDDKRAIKKKRDERPARVEKKAE